MWAPLRLPVFRALWIASLVSNMGTWMHGVGAAWLMTELSKDARLNALVSACESLPMFLLSLPAGALADIFDRRKLLAAMQLWACAVTGTLAVFTFAGLTGAGVLLSFTALLAVGSALSQPAWQSITPEIVKRSHYSAAVGLGGISWNIARVIGPALGGALIGILTTRVGKMAAPAGLFAINSLSFLAVVWVVTRWKRALRTSDLPPEHVVGAMRTGLNYVRHTPAIRAVLVRVVGYIFFGSALWALLPLHARIDLKLDATGYGTLLGFFGLGAIAVGASIEHLRARFSPDALVSISSVGAALGFVLLATLKNPWLSRLAMVENGFAWPLAMLSFQVAVVKSAPDWIRSRAASLFLLVFTGSQTLGAATWGFVAQKTSIPITFGITAFGLVASLVVLRRFRVEETALSRQEPSNHWPQPVWDLPVAPSRGPVLVTTEFCVAPDKARSFVEAMQAVRTLRLREGVLRWNLFQDAARPERWIETMLLGSWNDHLRQHERVSVESAELEARAWSFHGGQEPPHVSHMLSSAARVWDEEDEAEPARWEWST